MLTQDAIIKRLSRIGIVASDEMRDGDLARLVTDGLGPMALGLRCRAALFYSRVIPSWDDFHARIPAKSIATLLQISDRDRISKLINDNESLHEDEMDRLAELCRVEPEWIRSGSEKFLPEWLSLYVYMFGAYIFLHVKSKQPKAVNVQEVILKLVESGYKHPTINVSDGDRILLNKYVKFLPWITVFGDNVLSTRLHKGTVSVELPGDLWSEIYFALFYRAPSGEHHLPLNEKQASTLALAIRKSLDSSTKTVYTRRQRAGKGK